MSLFDCSQLSKTYYNVLVLQLEIVVHNDSYIVGCSENNINALCAVLSQSHSIVKWVRDM